MQPHVLHIKPTRLSKATTFLQSLPTKEEEQDKLRTGDFTRSHALQNQMEEALHESLTPVRVQYHLRRTNWGQRYQYSEMMGDNRWNFEVDITSEGEAHINFKRNNAYEHPYRQGRYSHQVHGDLTELRRALGIIAYMAFDIISRNRDQIRLVTIGITEEETKKGAVYKRFAEILARKFGGRVEMNPDNMTIYIILDRR